MTIWSESRCCFSPRLSAVLSTQLANTYIIFHQHDRTYSFQTDQSSTLTSRHFANTLPIFASWPPWINYAHTRPLYTEMISDTTYANARVLVVCWKQILGSRKRAKLSPRCFLTSFSMTFHILPSPVLPASKLRFSILAAAALGSKTRSPGKGSFTTALIQEMKAAMDQQGGVDIQSLTPPSLR